ncbi:MAG TPA: LytTR family DNA-binding domain-containing protein [Lysobacter sp.]|nr:LytTR family DNA-binding domain-containing protein [Lysobacter sp.]
MSPDSPTALIADDEPLLRQSLARMLGDAWPELRIVAEARNGRDAVRLYESTRPDICFLDVHMPGMSGVEAACAIGRRAHLVFVTAFTDYAVQAFEQGALDYLVKPVEAPRLADTVARLKARLRTDVPESTVAAIEELAARLNRARDKAPLRWLRASVGQSVQLIAAERIDFLRSDEKYTVLAWRDEGGTRREALVRVPLKELVAQLGPDNFVQVHRSFAVNLAAVSHVVRSVNETAQVHLRDRPEVIPVSRSYLHVFRQM